MSIYTKTGDKGSTSLFGGKKLPKYDLQIEAYGTIDEVTCLIGSAYEAVTDVQTKKLLSEIQNSLYKIMAYLSNGPIKEDELSEQTKRLESEIDAIESTLPKLTRFVLPQGSEATSRLHIARSVIRRAERRTIEYIESKKEKNNRDMIIIQYLNRLSDLFFMLARKYSKDENLT